MRTADFDYHLPPARIAQRPAEPRDAARLLVGLPGTPPESTHRRVADLAGLLRAGDLLVVNDTRVRPARLFARRPSGARIEVVLLGPAPDHGPRAWRALANPARKVRVGEPLRVEGADPAVELLPLERLPHDTEPDRPGATWVFAWPEGLAGAALEALLERVGHMPLPPYIQRAQGPGDPDAASDRERYQTVFARVPGAVAAPTAGLHLTVPLLERLAAQGVGLARVTLHVGLGTFASVDVEDTADHVMHAEEYELTDATAAAVRATRERGGRVVAVGTTSVRVLESCAAPDGSLRPGRGVTRLFLTPGASFRATDLLLTNFHLPRSTLLMLVSAFSGRERVLGLYREAIEAGYRFYSYGDAMLLERAPTGV